MALSSTLLLLLLLCWVSRASFFTLLTEVTHQIQARKTTRGAGALRWAERWKSRVACHTGISSAGSPMSHIAHLCSRRRGVCTNHSEPYTQSKVSVCTKHSLVWLVEQLVPLQLQEHTCSSWGRKDFRVTLEVPEAFHSKASDVNGPLR